jgi:hypothetical protein
MEPGEGATRSCIPPVWQVAYVLRCASEILDRQLQKSSAYGSSITYGIAWQHLVPVYENRPLDLGIAFDTHGSGSLSVKGNRSAS